MRAIVIDRFQTQGTLRDVPEPPLEPNSVLIRVTCAGINPVDWKTRDGKTGDRTFPLVLGQDFAGVVERAGDRVGHLKAGDRVFGCARDHGSYAEKTLIRDGQKDSPFTTIPDAMSDEQAAALPTPGLTALASLEILRVARGTSLLIIGAGGAVGAAAVQIARRRGAKVAAVVKAGQAQQATDFGADEVIESSDDLVRAVGERHPHAFDAVFDLVNDGETLKKNAPLVKKGGRLVTTIHVADEPWFRDHDIQATNVVMYETPQSTPQGLDELARMVVDRTLSVEVATEKPLDEAPEVLDEVKAGKLQGKVVLRV
ncbi:MAG: NADP-dependent oxidoreductase [Candidatus Eremiobacteraeota bacterium]|nr:NADP-dependent oxidoreductase [Candidatus Eremiobacteraeota bacterium]MBC5823192.1 NADP-dependent oxidoreductase [Candidatus Eremiobacteraeota bacterium]